MRRFGLLTTAAVCLAASACSKSSGGGNVVTVTGKITADSKPVAGAMVQFVPEKSGDPASGRTGPDGTYKLVTPKGDPGAAPGKYKVTVSRKVGTDGKELPENTSPFSTESRETMPTLYVSPASTQLQAEVTAGKDSVTLDFDLKGVSVR